MASPAPTDVHASSRSAFLSLPGELRDVIYSHLLKQDDIVRIHVCSGHKDAPGHRILRDGWSIRRYGRGLRGPHKCYLSATEKLVHEREWTRGSAILFTCREIYAEAVKILYSSNAFGFANTTYLKRFLEGIGPERSQCLRHIMLESGGIARSSAPAAFKLLRATVNLRGLHLNHNDFCASANARARTSHSKAIDCEWLAEAMRPLVFALHRSYQTRGLRLNIFEVVRVSNPSRWHCNCVHAVNASTGVPSPTLPDDWINEEAIEVNKLIAAQLGVVFTDEIRKKVLHCKHGTLD